MRTKKKRVTKRKRENQGETHTMRGHSERERETDRQTDRQREREREED